MKIGIIYATVSKIVRRVYIPDNEAELRDPALIRAGESIIVANREEASSLAQVKAAVERETGVSPPTGRCVVVNGRDLVERVIFADPALDSIPNRRLVFHQTARVGDTVL